MELPNWFDNQYEQALKTASARQALAIIANDPTILQAVASALAAHDQVKRQPPNWAGPSRAQAIRSALTTSINS